MSKKRERKPIRMSLAYPFKGHKTAGLLPTDFARLSPEQGMQHRLEFVACIARRLADRVYSSHSGLPASVQRDAGEILANVRRAQIQLAGGSVVDAMAAGVELGLALERFQTSLAIWQRLKSEQERNTRNAESAASRAGKLGELKSTVLAMLEENGELAAVDVLSEFEADAAGRESMLSGLREKGRQVIEVVSVTAARFSFLVSDGSEKTRTIKTLENIVSELKRGRK